MADVIIVEHIDQLVHTFYSKNYNSYDLIPEIYE